MNTADVVALGERLGLRFNGENELLGERDGVIVRLEVAYGGRYVFAAMVPVRGFPEQLDLYAVIDLFEVRELAGRVPRLDRGWMCAESRQPPEETLALVVRAARAVAAWWRAPAKPLMDRHGLQASEDLGQWWGEVGGRPVEITEGRRKDGTVGVTVRAELPPSWAAVRLSRPAPDAPPVKVGDPVLDGRLAATGLGPSGVAALRADVAREALLAVLFAHGGVVRAGTVYAFADSLRDPARVERALRDAVDLASALAATEPG